MCAMINILHVEGTFLICIISVGWYGMRFRARFDNHRIEKASVSFDNQFLCTVATDQVDAGLGVEMHPSARLCPDCTGSQKEVLIERIRVFKEVFDPFE